MKTETFNRVKWAVQRVVEERKRVYPSEIAEELELPYGIVERSLQALERDGFVKRDRSERA